MNNATATPNQARAILSTLHQVHAGGHNSLEDPDFRAFITAQANHANSGAPSEDSESLLVTALELLRADPRFGPQIESLLAGPLPQSMAGTGKRMIPAVVLLTLVLQLRFDCNAANREGTLSINIGKEAADSESIAKILTGIAGSFVD